MRTSRLRPQVVLACIALAVIVIVAVIVATAPANWLARYVASRTEGRVVLADAQGTIWSGDAVVALDTRRGTAPAAGLALPGRVTWRLQFAGPLAPSLLLTHDGVLLRPVTVLYRSGDLEIDQGDAMVPASLLQIAGPPLNTLRPEGRCTLHWSALRLEADGALVGNGTLQVDGFALAVSMVRPLGDYRVLWSADRTGLTWSLDTVRGPLAVNGTGRLAGRQWQVRVVANTAPGTPLPVAAQLKSLFDTIGRPGQGEVVFEGRSPT